MRIWERIRAIGVKLFGPAVTVGNKERVRKPDEPDEDEKALRDLDRAWNKMLREDDWMIKLMTHVRPLQLFMLFVFLIFLSLGLYFGLPAKHWMYGVTVCLSVATFPYWFWIARWHGRIVQRVFTKFKERYGKHFHLK